MGQPSGAGANALLVEAITCSLTLNLARHAIDFSPSNIIAKTASRLIKDDSLKNRIPKTWN